MSGAVGKRDPEKKKLLILLYTQKKRLKQKSGWIMKPVAETIKVVVISADDRPSHLCHRWARHGRVLQSRKTLLFICELQQALPLWWYLKKQKMKIHFEQTHWLWRRSQKPRRSGLAALYLGAMWLSLDVRVADTADVTTRRARRSPGHGASGRGRGCAAVTGRSPAAGPPMTSRIPPAPRGSDPTMKERERDRMIKRVWENNGDGARWTWRTGRRVQLQNRSDWCVEIVKRKLRVQERKPGSFTAIAFWRTYPLFLAWGKVTSSGTKKPQKCWRMAQLSLQRASVSFSGVLGWEFISQSTRDNSTVYLTKESWIISRGLKSRLSV